METTILRFNDTNNSNPVEQKNLMPDYCSFDSQKSSLLATIAHDMCAPLQAASGFNSFLLQETIGTLNATQRDIIESISSCLLQLNRLVEDVICLDKLNSQKLEIDYALVDLNELVRETVSQFSGIAQVGNIELKIQYPIGQACYVLGTSARLQQCLQNLITNAIKFAPMESSITITLEQTTDCYRVIVRDEGPGISRGNLESIFCRHIHSNDSRYAGFGLGLNIAKDLIERHGGKIGVESQLGQGSAFWFSLPRIDFTAIDEEQAAWYFAA
ncbi:HAMP domain-containing sensor histidine kinase [Candidatus Chlorohelix sp.]|uniref:sensor histidine kinase n=1 Tax=Candidatus Chlorohelix sp. TaxID=3139201 RepID=UPI0030264135